MTVKALKTNNMKKGPFKMKGNPMKRNFGISPAKNEEEKKKEKEERNEFGETRAEYIKRMEEMGLRKPDPKTTPPAKK